MFDFEGEKEKIRAASALKNVDWLFVCAIRKQENGSAGREFGVISEAADNYDDQLRICVASVAHRVAAYQLNPLVRTPEGRLRYSVSWIAHFAGIWAPVGAKNDPTELNENWFPNVCSFYDEFLLAKQ